MSRVARVSIFAILICFSAMLSAFEIIYVPEIQFPLGISSDGSKIVGANSEGGPAVLWEYGVGATVLGTGDAWGISEDGKIICTLVNENENNRSEAAIWEDGAVTFLGGIPGGGEVDGSISSGLGISTDGSTTVGMGWLEGWNAEGYYWNAETGVVGLGRDNGFSSKAQAINGDGSVMGGWNEDEYGSRLATIWDAEGNISYINSFDPSWDYGEVNAISEDGSLIVGFCTGQGNNELEGFTWTEEGGLVGLGVPPNTNMWKRSWAFDYAENGDVLGQYLNMGMTGWKACIKTDETDGLFVDLNEYLEDLGMDLQGWDLMKGHCISDDGSVMAGTGIGPEGFGTWVMRLSPVGYIEGSVSLENNEADITQILVTAGGQDVHPDENGDFVFETMAGMYTVSASLFGYETSVIENVEVTAYQQTTGIDLALNLKPEQINAPQNLTVDADTGLASWEDPLAGNSSWLAWDNGINDETFGVEGGGTWAAGNFWDTSTLAEYTGGYLSIIRFFSGSDESTYTAKVWTGANSENLIVDQLIENVEDGEWNTYILAEPILLDALDNLYFGIEFQQPDGAAPAGFSLGGGIAGYGDMINFDGSWLAASEIGMDLNWNIQALVTDSSGRQFAVEKPEVTPVRFYDYASLNPEIYDIFPNSEINLKFVAGVSNETSNQNRAVETYSIYLNNMNTPITTDIAVTEYQLTDLTADTGYTVGVSSVYESGAESVISTSNFIYQREPNHFDPVNLTVNEATAEFSWELPGMWMQWDDGINFDGIGLEAAEGTEFGVASRWEPEHLEDYHNSLLTQISFFPLNAEANYTIKVWIGGDAETEVLSLPVTDFVINEWNTVTLDVPVTVDATNELWFGYWITNAPADQLVAGVDAGPVAEDLGDFIYIEAYGGWSNLSNFNLSHNWNLKGYFEANDEQLRDQTLTSFEIYLDDVMVADAVTETSHIFTDLQDGATYSAGVKAFYDDGTSEVVETSFSYTPVDTDANEVLSVTALKGNYPNPFNPVTTISYSLIQEENVNLEIFNIKGQKVKTLLNDVQTAGSHKVIWNGTDDYENSVSSGIYFYKMTTPGFSSVKKMILMK